MFWKRTPRRELVSRLTSLTKSGLLKWEPTDRLKNFYLDLEGWGRVTLKDCWTGFGYRGYIILESKDSETSWTSFSVRRLHRLVFETKGSAQVSKDQKLAQEALGELFPATVEGFLQDVAEEASHA